MNVLAFPATDFARSLAERAVPATVRSLPDRAAVNEADRPLHEILRKAIVAFRSGEDRTPGSLGHRHHLAIAHTYLDAAEILTGVPGAAGELAQCLDVAIFDVRKLARIARDYAGPAHA